MKSTLVILFSMILFSYSSFSQMRLTIGSNSFINIENQAKLVIDNPSDNAINDLSSSTGGIITENEFDQVVWIIGDNSGIFRLPFVADNTLVQIPFIMEITSNGISNVSNSFRFSTYAGNNWNNDSYRPSDVTHMYDYNTGTINNSLYVIDRFWISDALNYSTKPTVNLTFTYQDLEHLQVGNSIVENLLGAQRFNYSTNHWGDYLPQGNTNVITNQTSNVPVPSSDFFRSWTLSLVTNPLFLNELDFFANCYENRVIFTWNNVQSNLIEGFRLESFRNNQWEVEDFIEYDENLNDNYSVALQDTSQKIYRLIVVFNDLSEYEIETLNIDCLQENFSVYMSNNNITISYYSKIKETLTFEVFDTTGKLIWMEDLMVDNGQNMLKVSDIFLSKGVYFLNIKDKNSYTKFYNVY